MENNAHIFVKACEKIGSDSDSFSCKSNSIKKKKTFQKLKPPPISSLHYFKEL